MHYSEILTQAWGLYTNGGHGIVDFFTQSFLTICAILEVEGVVRLTLLTGIAWVIILLIYRTRPPWIQILGAHNPIQRNTEMLWYVVNILSFPFLMSISVWALYQVGWITFLRFDEVSVWRTLGEFVLIVVLHDAYFYWGHLLMHHPKLFPYTHRIHHVSTVPTPFTSYSYHPFETLIEFAFAPLYLVLNGLLIHGISIVAILAFGVFYASMNFYHHSSIEFLPHWWTQNPYTKWISTSVFHFRHHNKNDGNFGFYFNVWDRLNGTLVKNYDADFARIRTNTHADR